MKSLRIIVLLVIAEVVFSSHVPFLKPNQFTILHNRFQVESSFTEDPFQADFAMKSPFYYLIDGAGNQTTISPSAETSAAVYLEPAITGSGTFRINAAQRKGPKYRGVETIEGKQYFSKDTLIVKGKKITLQYFSGADTYVCKGLPNYMAKPLNKGVEIIPLSSPNTMKVNQPYKFQVYQDGEKVAHARVVVAYDDDHYIQKKVADLYDIENVRKNNIHADQDGVFTFTPEKPGLVLLFVTIHKQISDTDWESYNNSLTLEVRMS
ncbi:DUF4198 domain-containing protein [Mangrovibacterium sp.]|uniref:DUF4198 domain-containing protein n=1 Tax=Mangrovibacterium sp. TaxID=1961364 RepID=UPI00356AAF3C